MKELAREYFEQFSFAWTKPEPVYLEPYVEKDVELIQGFFDV